MSQRLTIPESITLRRSFQGSGLSVLFMGVAYFLTIGVYGLFDSVSFLAGDELWNAYLIFAAITVPTLLSHVELRHWVGRGGGSYRLIKALERSHFTFLAAWLYLLIWVSLSALLAWIFADYGVRLIELFFDFPIPRWALVIVLIVFFTLRNLPGQILPWHYGQRVAMLTIISVLALIVLTVVALIFPREDIQQSGVTRQLRFGPAIVLTATYLMIDHISSRQPRRRLLSMTMIGVLIGPILAAILGLLAVLAFAGLPSIAGLADTIAPLGKPIVYLVAILAAASVWQSHTLSALRQAQTMSADGVLPSRLTEISFGKRTPLKLVLGLSGITIASILVANVIAPSVAAITVTLAYVAAFSLLIIQIGVNFAAIMLARSPRAERRSFKLPLYPLIPATGAAISFLYLLGVPFSAALISVVWLAIGLVVYWQYGRENMRTTQLGLTVFQDTQSRQDVTSDFPVVVPISNPATASGLAVLGASIARYHGGHVTLLQVIQVPDFLPLDARRIEARHQLDLLEELMATIERMGVRVEAITRLSRNISQGVTDTALEEGAKLIVLGQPNPPRARDEEGADETSLGSILDPILQDASCEVAVVCGEMVDRPSRILVAINEGVNAESVTELAVALAPEESDEITLVDIIDSRASEIEISSQRSIVENALNSLKGGRSVSIQIVPAKSTLYGILDFAADYDLILVEAGAQGILEQDAVSDLPLDLIKETEKPVLLVRGYTGMTRRLVRKSWNSIAGLLPRLTRAEQIDLFQEMRVAARSNVNFFVLMTLSTAIATLGLLQDSEAVVIGAMLIAPLMGPIIATAAGITFGNLRILQTGLTTTLQGILYAIFVATLITLILPITEPTNQVLARTSPNLIDLMIALASGMAGAYAKARKEVGDAIPGAAIAVALVPPLGTVGIGLALGDPTITFGALLLFLTNLIAIIFASAMVFLLLGVRPPRRQERESNLRQGLLISLGALAVISIPLAFALVQTTQQDRIEQHVRAIVVANVEEWGNAQLVELTVSQNRYSISVQGRLHSTGPILQEDIDALNEALDTALNGEVLLSLFDLRGELWLPTDETSGTVEPDSEFLNSESTPLPDSQDE